MGESLSESGWDLNYDAALFIPLPSVEELSADPERGPMWVGEVLEHYAASAPLTDGDRQGLTVTAEALLSMAEPFVMRLWFAPPGFYSDVLVSLVVTDAEGDSAREIVQRVTENPGATAPDGIAIESDTHGSGVLIRRTAGVQAQDSSALLVAQWDLLLHVHGVLIAANVMATTLPVLAQLEGELLALVEGIVLPDAVIA